MVPSLVGLCVCSVTVCLASGEDDNLSLSGPRLCVSVLAMDRFGDGLGAAYGLFDGDRNEEVPRLLQCTMGDVLAEELQHSSVDRVFMSHTFLTSHR